MYVQVWVCCIEVEERKSWLDLLGDGNLSHGRIKAGRCRWIGFLHMSVGDFVLRCSVDWLNEGAGALPPPRSFPSYLGRCAHVCETTYMSRPVANRCRYR